jgi:rhodanese-related sulfurtransferase
VVLAENAERVRESQLRLARVGIENVAGYVESGLAGWAKGGGELEDIAQMAPGDLEPGVAVLDVREPGEREAGAIPGSVGIPLGELNARAGELDRSRLLVVHCKGGYRSSIATSLLRRHGFTEIANLVGGYDAWKAGAAARS